MNKSPRILYIEDEETLAQLVKRRLDKKGFQVEFALDGESGLAMLLAKDFDIVIVDYQLPKMNGLDVLQHMAEQNITTSAIMVSGMDDIRIVVKAMNLGCMDYIVKDGNSYLELLPIHIESVIAKRKLEVDKKLSEKKLHLAQQVFDTTTEGIMVTGADEKIISVNPAFTKITGYEKEDVIDKSPRVLQSGEHDDLFYKQMWHELTAEGQWAGEIWNRKKTGELYPEWLSIAVIYDANGDVEQYVSIFSDITQHKAAEKQIEYQANYDALTGLPNRNLFNDRLATALKVAQRESSCLALLFLDLDRFKWVNDTLGHRAGDTLLKETAKRLESILRESDSVSRLGGDEFMVILTDLDKELDSELIAEKILMQLALPYQLEDQEVYVTGSIGITVYPSDGKSSEHLYRNADNAMYAAKEAGRNQFSFFTAEMQKQAETRLILLNELRQAIEGSQFELYYQPVIDMADNSLYGAEALIRWNHPERGVVGPFDFIPLAEETGLIQPIGAWVVEQALQQLKKWNNAGHEMHIAVNKSSKQFHSNECASDLHNRMDALNIDPEQLTIEITETVLMEEQDNILKLLEDYRQAGITISLDDFGTGYSSLSYLRKFPFDILKIDRSFVMDMTTNKDDALLVETIIMMGHQLGLRVVAEGVETEQQRDFLQDRDCDFLQGYLYSRPIPAAEFEQQFIINQEWKHND